MYLSPGYGLREYAAETIGENAYERLQELVERVNLSELSSIKQIVLAIIRVITDPDSTVKELKDVIQLDPPLAGKILKTANSAYYSRSFSRTYTDIEQAIIWIGTETIKELALNQKVCELFNRDERIEEYTRRSLWWHSIAVAIMAKLIYRREFALKGEDAYAAGLLHDFGIIAEDQFCRDEFQRTMHLSQTEELSMTGAETVIFGFDHTWVGGEVALSWDLPKELTIAIGFHHDPFKPPVEFSRMVYTLYVADFFCQDNGFSFGAAHETGTNVLDRCLSKMEIKPQALNIIFKSVREEIKKMEDRGLI